ncbi:MAG: cytochrome ubiquinol oxidase subunit I, partial [Brevundimonas aurantiaca]
LAVWCIMHWCWMLDRPRIQDTVDVGAGIRVPTYVSGPSSHGWWAMVITLIVAGMIEALAGFSYVFLWSRNPQDWIAPPDLVSLALVVGGNVVAAALARSSCKALAYDRPRSPIIATGLMVLAAAVLGAAWYVDLQSWIATGLQASMTGQGATVFALLSWHGFFVSVVALMAVYAVLRWAFGHVEARRPSTFDLIALFI